MLSPQLTFALNHPCYQTNNRTVYLKLVVVVVDVFQNHCISYTFSLVAHTILIYIYIYTYLYMYVHVESSSMHLTLNQIPLSFFIQLYRLYCWSWAPTWIRKTSRKATMSTSNAKYMQIRLRTKLSGNIM